MAANSDGHYRTTPALTMAAFDKLPPLTRAALRNAVDNWVAQRFLTMHRRGMWDSEVAAVVAAWDAYALKNRDIQRCRAIGPYKGNVPTA